jgi:hypothetical protein
MPQQDLTPYVFVIVVKGSNPIHDGLWQTGRIAVEQDH